MDLFIPLQSFTNVNETVLVPASANLRKATDSTMLNDAAKDGFHYLAYKLMYLAKRTRPEMLPAAHFCPLECNNQHKKTLQKHVIVYDI